MKVASFFSGAGGLDQGFLQAGYTTLFANEFDRQISNTFQLNHQNTNVYTGSIVDLLTGFEEARAVDGFIGGPPCQSWSAAGAKRGVDDPRGLLFFSYLKLISDIQPQFFVAENVPGILAERNSFALNSLLESMDAAGYNVSYGLLNAADYGVPQDRKRVIFVGINKSLKTWFRRPPEAGVRVTLAEALVGLDLHPRPEKYGTTFEPLALAKINNHHFLESDHFSPIYMSRNRVRPWDGQSFTIQASASHVPLHPSAPPMEFVEKDRFQFAPGYESIYRRLSVRECARIQNFSDDYKFHYTSLGVGYKMIGNAVPVGLAEAIGREIQNRITNPWVPDLANGERHYNFS